MGKEGSWGENQGTRPVLPDRPGKLHSDQSFPDHFLGLYFQQAPWRDEVISPSRGGAAGCKKGGFPKLRFLNCDRNPLHLPSGTLGPTWTLLSHSLGLIEPGNQCKLAAPALLWVIKLFISHPASMKQQQADWSVFRRVKPNPRADSYVVRS